jgi:hypothetical protein
MGALPQLLIIIFFLTLIAGILIPPPSAPIRHMNPGCRFRFADCRARREKCFRLSFRPLIVGHDVRSASGPMRPGIS